MEIDAGSDEAQIARNEQQGSLSEPSEHSLTPCVHKAKQEDEDKDRHFDETEHSIGLEPSCPREDEDGFDVEHHEQQSEHVIPNVALAPAGTDRVYAGLVSDVLLRLGTGRPYERAQANECADKGTCKGAKYGDRQVATKELGHGEGA